MVVSTGWTDCEGQSGRDGYGFKAHISCRMMHYAIATICGGLILYLHLEALTSLSGRTDGLIDSTLGLLLLAWQEIIIY